MIGVVKAVRDLGSFLSCTFHLRASPPTFSSVSCFSSLAQPERCGSWPKVNQSAAWHDTVKQNDISDNTLDNKNRLGIMPIYLLFWHLFHPMRECDGATKAFSSPQSILRNPDLILMEVMRMELEGLVELLRAITDVRRVMKTPRFVVEQERNFCPRRHIRREGQKAGPL